MTPDEAVDAAGEREPFVHPFGELKQPEVVGWYGVGSRAYPVYKTEEDPK